ncbi:MAG: hypothetical protein HEQ39_18135 [Rhizobacter sp.]
MTTTTQITHPTAPILLADASAIGMGWSKPSAGASDGKVKSYLGQVLNSLTGGKIDSIERLVYFDGKRRAQLEASLNKEVVSASGGRLSDWRQLLSASGREALQRQTASSNPPANKPAPSNAPWKIGGVDVGAGARQVWNGVKNVPNPLLGGLTPNQAGQVLKGGYNATVRTGNQVLGGPVFPVAEPASSFASVRARADALVARASKGKFDSVADLVHFAGDNKAANRLRGQVTQMLQKDAGAQAGGFSNWKQVLTGAERGQLERTLDNIQNDTPAKPLQPKEGNLISGINRNVNQILAPFNASLPTQQDNSLQAMRGGANFVLDKAGLPKLQELAKIPFDDPRRVKADQVLGQYLHSNNLYGALAKLPSGKTERIDHWTDLFAPSELNRFVGGMEKALLPKAVALSGVNDPEGRTMQVPKDEAFKQIGEIKQKVQDYFGGAWPDAAKPLLGTLDALQGYTMDRQVDALRTKLTQSGRPIDKLVSMGIGFVRVANPAAVIGNLIKLDQEIARTNSTKPLEQALSAIGMQFKDVAGVGKDLAVLLARGDKKGAEALLKKNYDLSTVEGQDRATAAINTLLTVYGGAKLTQAGLKKLGIFKDPNASALVPVKQTPSQAGTVGRLAPALEQLKSLTAQVDDAIQSNNLGRLQQLKAQMTGLLGEARKLGRGSGDIRSGDFKAVNIAAEQALVRIDGALKVKVPATPPVSTNKPVNKPVVSTPPEVKTPIVPPTTASTPPVKLEPVLGNVPVQPAVDTSGVRQYQLHPGPIGSVPISQSGRGDVVPKIETPTTPSNTQTTDTGKKPIAPNSPEGMKRLKELGLPSDITNWTPQQLSAVTQVIRSASNYKEALLMVVNLSDATGVPDSKLMANPDIKEALNSKKKLGVSNITSQSAPPRVVAMMGGEQPGGDLQAVRVQRIVQQIQEQVTGISPNEMQRVLQSNRTSLSEAQYGQVVLKLVQFGSVNSMRDLAVGLKNTSTSPLQLIDPGIPSLQRAMLYAQKRQMLPPGTLEPISAGTQPTARPVVVMDKPLLQRLEQDVELRRQFRQMNPVWVYPRGSDRGASPVFQPSPGELKQLAQTVAGEVEALMRKEQLPFSSALGRVLDGQVQQHLQRLGLSADSDHFYAVDNPNAQQSDAAALSKLTTSQTLPLSAVQKTLDYSPPQWKEAYLFIFEHGLTVPSRADIQERMQKSYLEVLGDLKVANRKESDMYLLTGKVELPKSDSVIAAQFAQVNKIPASRFVALDQFNELPRNAVVLIVDDVAATGTQMAELVEDLLQKRPDITVRSTTLITTSAATNLLNRECDSSLQSGRYKHIVPDGGSLSRIDETARFLGLPEDVQATVLKIMGGGFGLDPSTGRGNIGHGIFLPFTGAPDNNSRFLRHSDFVDPLSNGNRK